MPVPTFLHDFLNVLLLVLLQLLRLVIAAQVLSFIFETADTLLICLFQITASELQNLLESSMTRGKDTVQSVRLMTNQTTGIPRGFGQ